MTAVELDQLYPLRKEVEHYKDKILEYTLKATSGTSVLTGMPHGTGVFDKVGEYQAKIHDLRKKIKINEAEIHRLETWLSNIPDVQTRLILQMRYDYYDIQPYWKDIAAFVGGGNTESSVKLCAWRFLQNTICCNECNTHAQNI
ncbi:MAG: hypothetical protein Q8873_00655 [Bacillota bacterium]|nr:hypothetical protein [Bacillota bacterium]